MSENLRDEIQDVARAFIVREVGEDAGPMMTEQARDFTAAVWAVVGPELDRLGAEVERGDRFMAIARENIDKYRLAAVAAEAQRDVLRARLAKVEALAEDMDDFEHDLVTCPKYSCPDCTVKNVVYDLRAALASVPEPSDSEPVANPRGGDRETASEPAPCRCHDTHAAITARHEGHCCFYPGDRKCHPTEVEAWAAAHRALTKPAPDADREAGER